jgi:hypothetical protein
MWSKKLCFDLCVCVCVFVCVMMMMMMMQSKCRALNKKGQINREKSIRIFLLFL